MVCDAGVSPGMDGYRPSVRSLWKSSMKRFAPLLCLCLLAASIHAQPQPSGGCAGNAYAAIAAFESYVHPKSTAGAEWIETRCVRWGEDDYHMELVANCGDDDPKTTNLIVISAKFDPFGKCATSTNKNARCNEYIPLAGHSIPLSDEGVEAWEIELTGICELYVYTPPE